jgi:hypothetical protein
MSSRQSEKLREELMQAARQVEWPAVRTEGFEARVMARLAARREPASSLALMGWAAGRLAPGLAVLLVVLSGVTMLPQSHDWTSILQGLATYLVLGVGL